MEAIDKARFRQVFLLVFLVVCTFFVFAFCIGFGSVKIDLKEVIYKFLNENTKKILTKNGEIGCSINDFKIEKNILTIKFESNQLIRAHEVLIRLKKITVTKSVTSGYRRPSFVLNKTLLI